MPVENAEVSRVFRQLADLLEIQGANVFRVRAYRSAARTVDELPESVDAMARQTPERLAELPGIGKDLAGKIVEIVRTGRLSALQDAAREVPTGLADLMRVRGLGPKRARALHQRIGIRSLAQLEKAARAGEVRTVPGFGAKTEQHILDELAAQRPGEHRVLRPVATQYGQTFLDHLRVLRGVRRAEIAGSYRRCRETVGDLDILVSCSPGFAESVADRFVTHPEVEEVLSRGPTKASVRLRSGLQIDLRVLDEESYGAGLVYFTGSKAHNIALRRRGLARGLKINEYGVFRRDRRVAGRTEADVYAAVSLPFIPPELREGRGEIAAAEAGTLPRLVTLQDMRGDLQMHTTDSDGRDDLETMVEAARGLGREYIAITDHSPALRMVAGLDRAGFRAQMRRIEKLNGRLRGITVLAGAEVDILPDGSLDLDDETLAELHVVVAAVHSKFELPERQQTERVLRAVRHPSVDIIGHPTGRVIGRRAGMSLHLGRVIRAAVDEGVLLEINAQPERLDLDDVAARTAHEMGARLVISTDAHAAAELRFMHCGVEQARRGWTGKDAVANSRSLRDLVKLLHQSR